MKYGFVLPGGSAQQQLEQAVTADRAGWDGVFVWEAAYGVDPWTLLAGMAAKTSRVRLGTMLTPLPWRRPWKVASQVVTLDQVSDGRAVISIGLGATDASLGNTGEELDTRVRAEMMDEGIDIMRGFWEGKLAFEGKHYKADLNARSDLAEVAQPVQSRIPIWVVGAWNYPKSMRRVLRCDGILPAVTNPDGSHQPTPEVVRDIRSWLNEHEARPDFDIVQEGETPADDRAKARAIVQPWEEAGATWWIESRWEMPHASEDRLRDVRNRLEAGPPRALR